MKPAVFEFYTLVPKTSGAGRRQMKKLWWRAAFRARGLSALTLLRKPGRSTAATDSRLLALRAKLETRLAGGRADFKWRQFDLRGYTDFHRRVWRALHQIPFGQVDNYKKIAAAAGSPLASSACGQACGANPIILFIPCHRAVAAHGLGGFSRGLEWKKYFLALEGQRIDDCVGNALSIVNRKTSIGWG